MALDKAKFVGKAIPAKDDGSMTLFEQNRLLLKKIAKGATPGKVQAPKPK